MTTNAPKEFLTPDRLNPPPSPPPPPPPRVDFRGEVDVYSRLSIAHASPCPPTKALAWKSPSEEMPPDQKRVAVIVEMENGSWWTTMAEHINANTVTSEDYLSDVDYEPGNLDEYDKEKDCYWVKENWFESNLFGEENQVINRPVLFWAIIEKPNR